ncbi:MAG: glycosyltransferase [Caldimicrobium sp.]|nr:glycosyltransferase [Caldimicrobium sp.]
MVNMDFIRPKITDKNSGIYGHVDFVNSEGIGGWLIDVSSPEPRVVEIYINDEKIGEAIANLPRPDIASIIGREANCGFFVKWGQLDVPSRINLEDNFDIAIIDKLSGREIIGRHAKGRKPKFFGRIEENKRGVKQEAKIEDERIREEYRIIKESGLFDEVLTFPFFEKVKASIVIPVYNKFEYTYNCLKSIRENTDEDISYEIIIADDCSNDETQFIHKYVKGVTIIRNPRNLGFLRNINNANRLARGEYLVLLNNDTIVSKGWLKELIETFKRDNRIGIVGPKFLTPDGRLLEAGGIIWRDGTGWNYGRGDDPSLPEYNYLKEVDYISGACIVIKKELWNAIGGFDDRYAPAYFEDSDLAFECRKRGYKVVYQPKVEIIHIEGVSHGTDISSGIKKYQEINRHKFVEKWKDVLEKEHLPNGVDPFLARDRSINKPHLLVIDHYVPMYDIGAGERTIYMWLKILKNYFQITFIGENFYKHEPYTTELQQMGIEVLYGPKYASGWKEWMYKNLKYFDYILLSRGHIAKKFIDVIKEIYNGVLVYYPHDLSYIRLFREYEISKNEKLLKEAEYFKALEHEIMSKVDIILLPSETEKEIIKQVFPNKKVLCVPPFIYDGEFPLSPNSDFSKREGIMFIGGFRHTPNLPSVKWFVEKVWNKILSNVTDITFYIVGADCPKEIYELQNKYRNIKVLGKVSEDELKQLYNKVKISIAPLLFGAGVKGKVIEAIAHGVPVVTTSIGAEGIPEIEKIAIIADDEQSFADGVITLYTDENLWKTLRESSIDFSRKYLSKNAVERILKHVFNPEIDRCIK